LSNLEKSLVVLLIFTAVLAFYFFTKIRRNGDTEDLNPLDSGLISWFALLFVFFVFCAYIYFGENKYNVPENIGQIGDFIGGLTNPVLSFLALLVLLRTTSIQTREARKTTMFMAKQQEILEREKFEGTFFKILEQIETFCERHFRDDSDGACYGEELAEALCAKYEYFSSLDSELQISSANKLIRSLTINPNCIILRNHATRLVRFLHTSEIDRKIRWRYASILRDTIYPNECIVISSMCYMGDNASAQLLKEWGFVHLNRGFFPCKEIEYYYNGAPEL